jgi:hypothetical protein
VDGSASTRSRFHENLALHQLQPFSHADQSYTVASKGLLLFKTSSIVGHCELDQLLCAVEIHRKVPNAAVLYSVLQRLL